MGLAPSKLIDFPKFSVDGEVPVPFFHSFSDELREFLIPRRCSYGSIPQGRP